MERIVSFIEHNIVAIVAVGFGVLAPGGLTIAVFNMRYFVELDVFKLIFLSFIISAPIVGFLFIAALLVQQDSSRYKDGKSDMAFAAILNVILFGVALFIKIVFIDLTKKQFVIVIFIECVFVLWLTKDDIIKNYKQSKQNDDN